MPNNQHVRLAPDHRQVPRRLLRRPGPPESAPGGGGEALRPQAGQPRPRHRHQRAHRDLQRVRAGGTPPEDTLPAAPAARPTRHPHS